MIRPPYAHILTEMGGTAVQYGMTFATSLTLLSFYVMRTWVTGATIPVLLGVTELHISEEMHEILKAALDE